MNYIGVETKLEVDGEIYYGKFAQIDYADFGMYDNTTSSPFGSLHIGLEGDGWGIGNITSNILYHDKFVEEGKYEELGRSMEFIVKILRLVGASSINDLVGKSVLSLWNRPDSLGETCVGITKPYSDFLKEDDILIWDKFFSTNK